MFDIDSNLISIPHDENEKDLSIFNLYAQATIYLH